MICPACDGDGELVTSHRFECYHCKGSGEVTVEQYERALIQEQECARNLARSVSISEYRSMG